MPLSVILQTLNSRDLSFTLTSGTGSLCNLQQFSSILFNKQWANEWMNSSNPIVHTGYQRYLMDSPYPQKEEGVKNKCMCACSVDSVIPWTAAHQAPVSMGFSRQEHWCGLPFPSPGNLPSPEIRPTSPVSPALAGGFFTTEPRGKP